MHITVVYCEALHLRPHVRITHYLWLVFMAR